MSRLYSLLFVAFLLGGCASNGTVTDIFNVKVEKNESSSDGSSNVVEFQLKKKIAKVSIPQNEEALAQKILTDNQRGESTKWKNRALGELSMKPTSDVYKLDPYQHCRSYSVSFIHTGTFRTPYSVPGVACKKKDNTWIPVR